MKIDDDTRESDRTAILFKAIPNAIVEVTMIRKLLGSVAVVALLASTGVANAKDPVKLSDGQLDKVTAGAVNFAIPTARSFLANGAGFGGVNQFSPSTATVTQTVTPTQLNLFTVH